MNKNGKLAIVTGGARGIGREICLELSKQNLRIVIFDVSEEAGQKLIDLITSQGGQGLSLKVDVGSYQEVEQAVKIVIDKFKVVDILVNNAGITHDRLILTMKEEDWDQVIRINLKGTFNCLKAVSKYMLRQRYGRIVNISSIIGLRGNAGQANYAASKAGIIALTKSAAREFARRGITVNAVAPGFIDTPMTKRLEPEKQQFFISQIPLGRAGKTKEVANLVSFLISDRAGYITGEVIKIDGGMGM